MAKIYNTAARARIDKAVKQVESGMLDLTPKGARRSAPLGFRWLKLTESFDSETGEAEANLCDWSASANAGAGELTESSNTQKVRNTTGAYAEGNPGDFVFCRPIGTINGTVWEMLTGNVGGAIRVAKLTTASSATAPTQAEADAYAAALTTVDGNLDTCVAGLTVVADPGFPDVTRAAQSMIDAPAAIAESLAGQVDAIEAIEDAAQALLDAHAADITAGGSGTLTAAQVTDYNAIVTACNSAESSIAAVASDLADHVSGDGTAAIYAENDYGVMVATGESVAVKCELLADGESIATGVFIYIIRDADDGKYRIVSAPCPETA